MCILHWALEAQANKVARLRFGRAKERDSQEIIPGFNVGFGAWLPTLLTAACLACLGSILMAAPLQGKKHRDSCCVSRGCAVGGSSQRAATPQRQCRLAPDCLAGAVEALRGLSLQLAALLMQQISKGGRERI